MDFSVRISLRSLFQLFSATCAWIRSILKVLAELHNEPDLKINLKFEIEVSLYGMTIVFVLVPLKTHKNELLPRNVSVDFLVKFYGFIKLTVTKREMWMMSRLIFHVKSYF